MNPSDVGDFSGGSLTTQPIVAPGDTTATLVFPSTLTSALVESTILRIRGNITVPKSDYGSGAALGVTTIRAFGIGIVSEQAASVIGAVPNPATTTGYDWDGWMFVRQGASTALEPNAEIVDIKAMRKWKSGDAIVFVAGLATDLPAGTGGADFFFSLRGLFLLP